MKNKLLFGFVVLLCACTNSGGTWQHYRLSALTEAEERGMTIYLHFFQAENKICEKQKSELEGLIKEKAFEKVGAYRVAWGTEKALQNFYKVTEPCALLILKGDQLKTRITSDVGPELLKMALKQGL
ncbi:MAG: hypothetical protein JWQ35_375 [Bacteriovoracaceae bacterium]|nr:hypothetical protein [Bacteriovoracaceae bacterium]